MRVVLIALTLLLGSAGLAACQENKENKSPAKPAAVPAPVNAPPASGTMAHAAPPASGASGASAPRSFNAKPAAGTVATCPVSGETFTVDADTEHAEYNGQHFAFCCPECKPRFEKDPAKFAAK